MLTAKRATYVIVAIILAIAFSAFLTGCEETTSGGRSEQLAQSEAKAEGRQAPDVSGDTEYNNYIKAQEEVYDDPSTILWCTVFPQSTNVPIFTVAIQGKLTSSSVSYFPNSVQKFSPSNGYTWTEEAQSVDGMYHGTPAPYRYGFTPGGDYADFMNLPTFCTTNPVQFQEESLIVNVEGDEAKALLDAAQVTE